MARYEINLPDDVKENLKKFAQNSGSALSHYVIAAICEKSGISVLKFNNPEEIQKVLDVNRYNESSGIAKQLRGAELEKITHDPEKYVAYIEHHGLYDDEKVQDGYRRFIIEDHKHRGLRQVIALISDFNSRLRILKENHRLEMQEKETETHVK